MKGTEAAGLRCVCGGSARARRAISGLWDEHTGSYGAVYTPPVDNRQTSSARIAAGVYHGAVNLERAVTPSVSEP